MWCGVDPHTIFAARIFVNTNLLTLIDNAKVLKCYDTPKPITRSAKTGVGVDLRANNN